MIATSIALACAALAIVCLLAALWSLDRHGELRTELERSESKRAALFLQLTQLERTLGDALDENQRLHRGALFSAVFLRAGKRRGRRVIQ